MIASIITTKSDPDLALIDSPGPTPLLLLQLHMLTSLMEPIILTPWDSKWILLRYDIRFYFWLNFFLCSRGKKIKKKFFFKREKKIEKISNWENYLKEWSGFLSYKFWISLEGSPNFASIQIPNPEFVGNFFIWIFWKSLFHKNSNTCVFLWWDRKGGQ